MMSARIEEIRRRLSEGESLDEILWGVGWQTKYPSLALLKKYAGISRTSSENEFHFGASVRSGSWFHSTDHEILKFTAYGISEEAINFFEERISEWLESNGTAKLEALKQGWMHGEEWKLMYPSIARWSAGGKNIVSP